MNNNKGENSKQISLNVVLGAGNGGKSGESRLEPNMKEHISYKTKLEILLGKRELSKVYVCVCIYILFS